jgi:hypothetical protein
MLNPNLQILGAVNLPQQLTAAGGTPFAGLIPPYTGLGTKNGIMLYQISPVKRLPGVITHVSGFVYDCGGSTAQLITIMRPLNYTYFTAALPKNTTAIPNTTLKADPGVYSTNYQYNGGIAPALVADAAISSTNKYVAYQLADGTWQMDTIASGTYGSTLTLTTGTPNRTNGYVPIGSPFYYFGTVTLKDPATGQLNWQTSITASTVEGIVSSTQFPSDARSGLSLLSALNPGDPLIFYSGNATNGGTLEFLNGFYAKA